MQYESMTPAEAEHAYAEFLAERQPSLNRLGALLKHDGLDPLATLDGSLNSLREVQEHVTPHVRLRPGPRNVNPSEGPTWARYETFAPRSDVSSTWTIDGVISYVAEVLKQAVPGTTWRLAHNRSFSDFARNRPLLVRDTNYVAIAWPVYRCLEEAVTPDAPPADEYPAARATRLAKRDLRNPVEKMVRALALPCEPEPAIDWDAQVEVVEDDTGLTYLVRFRDPELVTETRRALTALIRALRQQPGVLDARWRGRRVAVQAPTWQPDQLHDWWAGALDELFQSAT